MALGGGGWEDTHGFSSVCVFFLNSSSIFDPVKVSILLIT